jgi:hypothetical protein
MRYRILGLTGVVILMSAGCNTASTTETPVEMLVQMQGIVTDGGTSLPIDGAAIEVLATATNQEFAAATTNAAGEYELEFVYRFFLSEPSSAFCPFLAFVEAPGYNPETISPLCTGDVETHNVELAIN